jgi:hypothetical protein
VSRTASFYAVYYSIHPQEDGDGFTDGLSAAGDEGDF